MVAPITTKIFATLGNNSSLVPLGVKDVSNTLGMTAGSYITGSSVEGKDRFIDEFGTQVIWLLGIPFFKEAINKTVYKIAGYNPKIDRRILENEDIFKTAKEKAIESMKKGFEKISAPKKQNMFKALSTGRFIAATALTMAAYSALTTFRHKHTEKNIIKEIKKEETLKKTSDNFVKEQSAIQFKAFGKKNNQKPSFGMNMSPLKQFMFDPVKNTMIIDGGISTQRLADSRNPQDFAGYVIKEGGFWAFMYFLGPEIQKHLEKKAAKGGKPIDLDIRILQDESFKKEIKEMTPEKLSKWASELKLDTEATDIKKAEAEIYNAFFEKGNQDNLILKMAKKAEIIKTDKKSGKISTHEYIDMAEIKGLKNKIENLYAKAPKDEKEFETFFKQILKSKKLSIVKNIGYSIGALGIVVPGIMVAMRFLSKENKEFAVKKEVHEKLKNQNMM